MSPERIIAVDLRPQTLAFVVLEGNDRVVDWGVKSFPGGRYKVLVPLRPKLDALFAAYVPDAIVLRKRGGTDQMLSEMDQVARTQMIPIHFLTRRTIKGSFNGCRNKDQIASMVCDRLPELLHLLPPKRKIWRKEYHRMRIFDAAATGIAYFVEKNKQATVPIPPI